MNPAPAKIHQIRLYIPIPQLEERLGKDAIPLSNYMKALERRTSEIMAEHPDVEAKGLLLAVGIKSKSKTRVWCQAVDGALPDELVAKVQNELAKIEAVDLLKAPAAFGLEIKLFGQTPEKFPEFPDVWREAAQTRQTPIAPPDDLFNIIWADQ